MDDLRHVAKRSSAFSALFAILILGMAACQTHVDISQEPSAPLNLKKILVLPFEDMSVVSEENLNTRCPVCGRVFFSGAVNRNATDGDGT